MSSILYWQGDFVGPLGGPCFTARVFWDKETPDCLLAELRTTGDYRLEWQSLEWRERLDKDERLDAQRVLRARAIRAARYRRARLAKESVS